MSLVTRRGSPHGLRSSSASEVASGAFDRPVDRAFRRAFRRAFDPRHGDVLAAPSTGSLY
jgi:hypothetical protein